jgi:hypothetical protein
MRPQELSYCLPLLFDLVEDDAELGAYIFGSSSRFASEAVSLSPLLDHQR